MVVCGDRVELDAEGEFDAVYSRDVFLHVHDKARLLAVLRCALARGGRLLVPDNCASAAPWRRDFRAYVTQRGYELRTIPDYVRLPKQSGFTHVRGEDRTADFIRIHEQELEALQRADLNGLDRAELVAGWAAKIARAHEGDQRWDLFEGRRGM